MSPRLPPLFWADGIYAFHVRDRDLLGALDEAVWQYAQRNEVSVVTINGIDFSKLARRGPHFGLIVIPCGGNLDQQFRLVMAALLFAQRTNTGSGMKNRYLALDAGGEIIAFEEHDLPTTPLH